MYKYSRNPILRLAGIQNFVKSFGRVIEVRLLRIKHPSSFKVTFSSKLDGSREVQASDTLTQHFWN